MHKKSPRSHNNMQRTIPLSKPKRKPKGNLRKIFLPKQNRSKEIRLITRKEKAHFNRIDKNIAFLQEYVLTPLQTHIFNPYIKPSLESYNKSYTNLKKDEDLLWNRLITYRKGPQMDAKWWFYNYAVMLTPIVLLHFFLEYQEGEMERILTEMENNDKGRLLGRRDDGEYKYDYDEALLRLEYDRNKSDVQKRVEKQMIMRWRDEEDVQQEEEEKGILDDMLQPVKEYVIGLCHFGYDYVKDLCYAYYNDYLLANKQLQNGNKHVDETKQVEQTTKYDTKVNHIPQKIDETEEKIEHVDAEMINDENTITWWNFLAYIPYVSKKYNDKHND